MVIGERLFGEVRPLLVLVSLLRAIREFRAFFPFLQQVDIAGQKFDLGVLEGGAGLVGDGHPAGQVHVVAGLVDAGPVIDVPAHLPGPVGHLDQFAPALLRVELPDKRGPGQEAAGQHGETHVLDVPDPRQQVHPGRRLQHQLRRIEAEERPLNDLAVLRDDADPLVDVLVEQLVGADEIVLVVLLDDAGHVRLAQGGKLHRVRLDGGRDVGETHQGTPLLQIHQPAFLDDDEVLVVDREADPLTAVGLGDDGGRSGFLRRVGRQGQPCEGQSGTEEEPSFHGIGRVARPEVLRRACFIVRTPFGVPQGVPPTLKPSLFHGIAPPFSGFPSTVYRRISWALGRTPKSKWAVVTSCMTKPDDACPIFWPRPTRTTARTLTAAA